MAPEAVDPTRMQVAEMRYFAGYGVFEVAELKDKSERSVRRQWGKAPSFLLVSMQQ